MEAMVGSDPQRIIEDGAKYCLVISTEEPSVAAKPLVNIDIP